MSVCECGNEKDKRSKRCKSCYIGSVKAMDIKHCSGCDNDLPLDRFARRNNGKIRAQCKACDALSSRKWREANPDGHKEAKRKWREANPEKFAVEILRKRARALGLDPDRIVAHFESHSGRCDICDRTPKECGSGRYNSLAIDHCHTTGEFRGLLCSECNLMLGKARDRIDVLESAIAYLKK
jgi:hypothetical protein